MGASSDIWQGGQDALICVDISDDAPDVRTFWFAAASGARFDFAPGQFVTLELGRGWRCFTIASPPTRPFRICLTIKKQPGSGGTAWLHESFRIGMRLTALAPAGRFALEAPPERKLALISAGSGATPMASMARWLHDLRIRVPVRYIHFARQQADLLFRDEINQIAADLGGWQVDWRITEGQGRPDSRAMRTLAPDLGNCEVFCCGPAGFMALTKTAFLAAGGSPEQYHEESFATPETPSAPTGDTTDGFEIRFEPSGLITTAQQGESLLSVAKRHKMAIPFACEQGICGSCRVRKISGEIEMNHQGGISDEEIADGEILACCSKPLSPIILQVA